MRLFRSLATIAAASALALAGITATYAANTGIASLACTPQAVAVAPNAPATLTCTMTATATGSTTVLATEALLSGSPTLAIVSTTNSDGLPKACAPSGSDIICAAQASANDVFTVTFTATYSTPGLYPYTYTDANGHVFTGYIIVAVPTPTNNAGYGPTVNGPGYKPCYNGMAYCGSNSTGGA